MVSLNCQAVSAVGNLAQAITSRQHFSAIQNDQPMWRMCSNRLGYYSPVPSSPALTYQI